jgi:hypothetical protein
MISRFLEKTATLPAGFCNLSSWIKITLTASLIFSTIACRNQGNVEDHAFENGEKIDVQVDVSGLTGSMSGNTLQTIEYHWDFSSAERLEENLMVKAHFVNEDNRVLFQDDHALPSAGSKQSYSRNLLIPLIPRPQNVRLMVGLYQKESPEVYYIKDKSGLYRNKVEVTAFRVNPPMYVDDLPEARITFGDGWYQKEYNSDQTDSWRWISDEARCMLKGADRELVLYIHGWVPQNIYPDSFALNLSLGDENLGTYTDLSGDFIIKMEISQAHILPNESEELIIRANHSFQPSVIEGSDDTRVLSAMIKQFYFN